MTFRIYGTQCAPKTHDTSIILDSVYNNYEQALDQANHLNGCSDLYEYTVVPESTVWAAQQEAECWFAEVGHTPSEDEMHVKHMQFIEDIIAFGALAAIGNTTYATEF